MPYCPICDRDYPATLICTICGNKLLPRATAGFAVSLIAGIIILILSFVALLFPSIILSIVDFFFLLIGIPIVAILGLWIPIIGIIVGILIIIGAILIYLPGKEYAGASIVLIFSLFSIVLLGGFIFGITLGIVGAALGFAKK